MPFRTTLAVGLAAAMLAAPAAAQQPAQQPAQTTTDDSGAPIVVTGEVPQAVSGAQVDHQARQITQGGDFLHTPLARFNDWLCPGIFGLKPEFAALMIDRMRAGAEALHIRLADDDHCDPNLVVAFVDDGKQELADLDARHGEMFMEMSTAERKDLLAETGPVRVWTSTVTRTRDGMPVPRARTLDNPPTAMMWMAHSKIYLPVRQDIEQVIVFLDKSAVRGKTLAQLADYAMMRGLARTKPSSDGQVLDSILTLFDPNATPPLSMTAFDRAYLGSVYDGIPNIAGATKIGGVPRQLRRQAAAGGRTEDEGE
jgi:hypothetical protein